MMVVKLFLFRFLHPSEEDDPRSPLVHFPSTAAAASVRWSALTRTQCFHEIRFRVFEGAGEDEDDDDDGRGEGGGGSGGGQHD